MSGPKDWLAVDSRISQREEILAARRNPITRQVSSVWVHVLMRAKRCQRGGRLEHDGGAITVADIADDAAVMPVWTENVPRDIRGTSAGLSQHVPTMSQTVPSDVAQACVDLLVSWGWLTLSGGVFVVTNWDRWNGEFERKLAERREKDANRKREYRRRLSRDVSRGTSAGHPRDVPGTSAPYTDTDTDTDTCRDHPPTPRRGAGASAPSRNDGPDFFGDNSPAPKPAKAAIPRKPGTAESRARGAHLRDLWLQAGNPDVRTVDDALLHKLGAAYSERPEDDYWRDVCAGAKRVNDRARQEGASPWVGLRRLPGNGGQAYAGQRLHALLAEGVYDRAATNGKRMPRQVVEASQVYLAQHRDTIAAALANGTLNPNPPTSAGIVETPF